MSHSADPPVSPPARIRRRVLVTGGAGFLGSSVAHALVARGDRVTVIDGFLAGLGANPANLAGIEGQIRLVRADLRSFAQWGALLDGIELVIHAAGNGDHGAASADPVRDMELNAQATLQLLEALREHAPTARLVHLGTRAEYGPVDRLPVDERLACRPQGPYAVSKLAATHYVLTYARIHGLPLCVARLTNVYGPRAQLRHPGYGVANWFLREALLDRPITVYGGGEIRRDYVYVDDAVAAIMALAECDAAIGQVVNVGGTPAISLRDLARAAQLAAGAGELRSVPFPAAKRRLEPGDFQADATRLRTWTGWRPQVDLALGLARQAAWLRPRWHDYVDDPLPPASAWRDAGS
jgi:UDP-glucose 4-epimerase